VPAQVNDIQIKLTKHKQKLAGYMGELPGRIAITSSQALEVKSLSEGECIHMLRDARHQLRLFLRTLGQLSLCSWIVRKPVVADEGYDAPTLLFDTSKAVAEHFMLPFTLLFHLTASEAKR
jgi:hypothetical protein